MNGSNKVIVGIVIAVIVILAGVGIYFLTTNTGNKNTTGVSKTASTTEKEEKVKNALEEYLKEEYGKVIEEVKFNNVKIYTQQEIDSNELFKDHNVGKNDIVFEANYELKIIEGYKEEEMMQFTAATGEIDGQWVRNKYNCGIARYNAENDYSITDFGTAF